MKQPTRLFTAGLLVALVGCGPETVMQETESQPIEELQLSSMSELQSRQHEAALAARDDLFGQLSGRLMEALADGGPAAAIPVCKTEAPRLAAEVGRNRGLEIGRTSHRLRNPRNAPPDWAEQFVEAELSEPRFVALENQRLGALLPIHLKTPCLMCHGLQDTLPPGVADALRAEYPTDQATGFQEGDLRGWFWVVVPADVASDTSNLTDASPENQGNDIAQ